ncbi:hypothetical protein ACEUYU_004429 [Vibrio vulnificus]
MNTINEKRIDMLNGIFTVQIESTEMPFNLYGNGDEEVLQVSIDQKYDSLKVAILSFDVPVYKSEFDCTLPKLFPSNSQKNCAGKFADGLLFINDVCIKSWSDLERA